MQDKSVIELESAEAGNENTVVAAGAWDGNACVSTPGYPAFKRNTPVVDEFPAQSAAIAPLYNVHIPFFIPKSMPEALGNSFWLVARQGARHLSRVQMPKPQMPKLQMPKIQAPKLQPLKLNLPAVSSKTLPMQNKKADYNSTIQRMQRVQSELKTSWQNFEPIGTAGEKESIKNQWNLPRIPSQPETAPLFKNGETTSKPKKAKRSKASERKAAEAAVSEPQQPVFQNTIKPAVDVTSGLDDIFPVQITSFFMNEKDAIQPEPIVEKVERVEKTEQQPTQIFEGVLVIEEIPEPVAAVEISVPETLEQLDQQTARNLPAVIEPGYHLPDLCPNTHETEVAMQLMLRNNKILSNSISSLAHRYFSRSESEESSTFLY